MSKVKIPRSEFKKPNKLTLIFIGTVATIILLIVIKVLISGTETIIPFQTPQKKVATPNLPSRPESIGQNGDQVQELLKAGVNPRVVTKLYLKATGFNEAMAERQAKQAKLVHEFKKKIHLDMKFPITMEYIDLDMDNDVAAILGTSLDGKKSLAVLATTKKVTASEAVDYLKASTDSFGFLNNHQFELNKTTTIPAPESTGLKTLTIIPATASSKGEDVFAALAERKDGKGTYLFMMAAPGSYFDQNEDGLEEMLKSVQAKP